MSSAWLRYRDAEGAARYTLPPESWDHTPPLARLLPTLFTAAEGTGNLLIVPDPGGGAQAVAEALDWEEWPEVLGTLAGDDTILVILRKPEYLAIIQRRIEELARLPAKLHNPSPEALPKNRRPTVVNNPFGH